MSPVDALIAVQGHDTTIVQLRHQHDILPARQDLAAAEQRRAELSIRMAEVEAPRAEARRDQKRREDEVALVEAKIVREEGKLYGGAITSPKEAQALQEELVSLKRHQTHLEDGLLEVMEQLEPLDADLAEFASEVETLDVGLDRVRGELAAREADLEAQIAAVEAERAEAASHADPASLATYERNRPAFGASTVVRFDGKNCAGCPSSMPAVEVDRMKKAESGSLLVCNECGRLVAT